MRPESAAHRNDARARAAAHPAPVAVPRAAPADGSELAQQVHALDWSATPLGRSDAWPRSLATAVELMLGSRQPAYVGWGPETTSLYNDAFVAILGDKHPAALGRPFREVFAEIWDEFRPLVEATMRGEAQHFLDRPVALAGRPGLALGWFTFSWTPLRDDSGAVGGFYCAATETTERVLAERRRLEEKERAVRESDRRYHALFDAIASGFCIVEVEPAAEGRRTDYRVIEANPAFHEHTGMPPEIIGRWMREAVPTLEEHWFETYGRVARTGEPVKFEAGSESLGRWFEVHAFRTGSAAQRQVAILFQDISARRATGIALRASEERLAFVVRIGDALRALADPDEIRYAAARTLAEHLGASRVEYGIDRGDGTCVVTRRHVAGADEGFPRTFRYDDYGPATQAELQAGRLRVLPDVANDPTLPDGHRRALLRLGIGASLLVPLVEDGQLVACLATGFERAHEFAADEIECARTVAERTWEAVARAQASAALRESETRFRNMAEHAPVMMWVTDETGWCTFLNARWYEFTGQSAREALGMGWLDATHPGDRERTGREFLRALERQAAFQLEYRLRAADGTYRWCIDAAAPRRDAAGRFAGYIGSVVDVSERWQAEEALREASRQKDEFLAMLAHELRNPMAPIRNAAELLARELPEDSPLRPVSGLLQRQSAQLARLVDDLLDVSRITRGRIELRRAALDLRMALAQALETVEPLLRERRHALQVHGGEAPLWIEGDFDRIVQALSNVLNNAAKYTDPGGRIDVRADASGDQAVVAIRDSGIGIAADMLPRVFDLFAQNDRAPDRSQGGLGIGLSVVRRLVEMHGGTVAASSGGIGAGSTFEMRLPRVPAPTQHATPAAPEPPPPRRLLIVDDNADAAESLAMLLTLDGHSAEFVTQPRLAVEQARRTRPDLVLLDIGMPEMDGFEVAHRLRSTPELAHVPIVAITGYGQPSDRESSAAAGFDAHLVKPVDYGVLQQVLSSLPRPGAPQVP
ncbi:MAG: PAS domain S-box protein [Steroidobacteraceae bacterium]|nr:PAS domain S-box protein [Steroidobacteraceae bacterium]